MGSQVNFYMTPEDEQAFVEFLRTDEAICIFKDRTSEPQIQVLDDLPERGYPGWFKVWLWNRRISPQPELEFVSQQNHYVINPLPNEVIEFSRSYEDSGQLVRGRLWVEFSGWETLPTFHVIKKSEEFRKWYRRLAGWIRRRAKRDQVGDYMMPGAARFADQGGILVQAVSSSGKRRG